MATCEGHGTTDSCISSDHANTGSVQASVRSFFARPGAPGVRHLHIEAKFDPGDTPYETWTDPWRQITAQRLEWLAPAMRTARSLRLTLVELMALGSVEAHRTGFAALFASCGPALETLHIDTTWRLPVYDLQWWDLPPRGRQPASVRRLIMETKAEVYFFTLGDRDDQDAAECGAPELHNLEHLVLRAPEIQIQSLYAFGAQLARRLTLQASRASTFAEDAPARCCGKQQLTAGGHCLELCCPTRDCIRSWSEDAPGWDPCEAMSPQEDEHLEELRSSFVETALVPDPEWCTRRSALCIRLSGSQSPKASL